MAYAIQIKEYGGPEVLTYQEVSLPEPGKGEALVKIKAAGVNFVDIYQRAGQYPVPLPYIPGSEAAGIIEKVGPEVTEFKVGDRVAYASVLGSYAEYAVVPAARLVPVPDEIDDKQAAATLLQGLTAHYLATSTYPLKDGDTALIHAGAGGVGLLLIQIAKKRGAAVIATVSTEEKAKLALEAGADQVIIYTQADFEAEVKRLTEGRGVNVVYDSVGKTTFDKSLNTLKPLGYLVLYGAASGQVPPFDLQILNAKGSLFITRPSLGHYIEDRASLLARSNDLFNWIKAGELKLRIEHVYPLKEAARAQQELASRATTGKLVLLPD
jgi:NADPH2:quinone reductase